MNIKFTFGNQPQDTKVHFIFNHNPQIRQQDKRTMHKLQLLAQYEHSTIPKVTWKHVYNELFK